MASFSNPKERTLSKPKPDTQNVTKTGLADDFNFGPGGASTQAVLFSNESTRLSEKIAVFRRPQTQNWLQKRDQNWFQKRDQKWSQILNFPENVTKTGLKI